jgi:hypothetical protein
MVTPAAGAASGGCASGWAQATKPDPASISIAEEQKCHATDEHREAEQEQATPQALNTESVQVEVGQQVCRVAYRPEIPEEGASDNHTNQAVESQESADGQLHLPHHRSLGTRARAFDVKSLQEAFPAKMILVTPRDDLKTMNEPEARAIAVTLARLRCVHG